MADFSQTTWVDETTQCSASNFNRIEAGVKDAAQSSKQRDSVSNRPAAASGNKNWIWTDDSGRGTWYSDGSNWHKIGGRSDWQWVMAVPPANVTVANPGTSTFDGRSFANGERIALINQTTGSQNGIYIFNGSGVAMTRAPDAAVAGDFLWGAEVRVFAGSTYGGATLVYSGASRPVVGTDTITFIVTDFKPLLVTALPATPFDGMEVSYKADATNGVEWHLRYEAAASGSYKWKVIGGSPLYAEVTTSETTTSTSYVALTTAGPSITNPLAGDYMIAIGAQMSKTTATSGLVAMSYDIGGTGAVDADWIIFDQGGGTTGNIGGHVYRKRRKTALAASTAIVAKYKTASGTGSFAGRSLELMPVRVG